MHISWHPEAQAEMIEATQFYEGRVAGLGADCLDAVDQSIAEAASDPGRLGIVDSDIRHAPLKRFPYDLYFRHTDVALRILVVKHHRRDADYWAGRT